MKYSGSCYEYGFSKTFINNSLTVRPQVIVYIAVTVEFL